MIKDDVRELLPIGSVVKLTGAEKLLMIFGVRQTNEQTGQEYDYIGVLYPEGNLGEEIRFLFDHSDIEETVFFGYESEERDQFMEKLNTFLHSEGTEA